MIRRFNLSFLFLFFSVTLFQIFLFLERGPELKGRSKIIEIKSGENFSEVTDRLNQEGLISRPASFRLLGRITGKERKIKPGEYRMHTALSPMALLDILVRGEVVQHLVVIPEGMSYKEIGQTLETAKLLEAASFYRVVEDQDLISQWGFEGKSLEGYLFPETYRFSKQMPPRQIAKHMATQFKTVYREAFQERAIDLGMTRREVVTLASIIEKETGAPEERPIISAVFHNRLKKNMKLQSDPTVIYSIADYDGNIRRKDLLNNSPYNTYHIIGLPPGPIANPGRDAIHAALYPADVSYLYFVSKNDGSHHFSRTLEEHNEAVRYYQIERKTGDFCLTCMQEESF